MENITNMSNGSLPTSDCPYDYCVEDTIYRKVVGTLIFLVVWPFIVQDIRYFPIGRPAAALFGATLMVVFTIAPQGQVYRVLGDRGNIQTICLLIGMMALSYYYDREGLLHIITLWIFGQRKPFRNVLWKVSILSAVLSALITNDATCVVITPLLLNEHKKQKRAKCEIGPLLLCIATSANIGSAATFFGNPQNAYIASNAKLSLIVFFITSLPAAIIGLAINVTLLYIIHYKMVFRSHVNPNTNEGSNTADLISGSISEERFEQSIQYDNSHDPFQGSAIAAERNTTHCSELNTSHCGEQRDAEQQTSAIFTETSVNYGATRLSMTASVPNLQLHPEDKQQTSQVKRSLVLSRKNSITASTNSTEKIPMRKRSLMTKLFLVWLIVITAILIALLAVPPQKHVEFNLGLVPIGAAVFTMLADTILNCKHSRKVMVEIDWPVILMFFGLFVWLAGFANTNLPSQAFDKIQKYMNLSTIGGVLLFTVFVIVGSNILSNVPLVILFIAKIDTFECGLDDCSQLIGVLLAWISTIAGNFTLIGSIANLIVAEKARSCTGYNLTFFTYLKFGFISTLLVLFSGLPIVYFTGRNVNLGL